MLIKRLLYIVIVIQLAMLGLVGLSALGYDIPILRPIIGFIYLTFIPGLLIIKILRLYKLNLIEIILYSVGLSLVILMLLGISINTLYPHISKPLSTSSLLITMTALVLLLCFLAYRKNYGVAKSTLPEIKGIPLTLISFSFLLVLLGILGSVLLSRSGNNIILLLLVSLISMSIIVVAVYRNLSSETAYPLVLWSISVSLLIIPILSSTQILVGGDIQRELFFLRLTKNNLWWDPLSLSPINSMLGITILPTIYSNMLNISEVWTVKTIYPLFASLIPLSLYQVYSKQTSKQIAFIATCFFITQFAFYGRLTTVGSRVMIAEIFFVLLMLVILEKEQHTGQKVLLIAFSIGLILSHYATLYIWMLFIVIFWVLSSLVTKYTSTVKFTRGITVTSVALLIVMAFGWYIYTSGSVTFNQFVGFGTNIANSLSEFFSPDVRNPEILIAMGQKELPIVSKIARYVYLMAISLVVIGFISSIVKYLRHKKLYFNEDYSLSSLIFMGFLVAQVILPFASVGYGIWRPYFQALFFLSPFFVLGGYIVFELISKPFPFVKENPKVAFVLIVLVVHFLFQVGFINIMTGQPSTYILAATGSSHDTVIVYETDDHAAQWLSSYGDKSAMIYRDYSGAATLLESYGVFWWSPHFRFFADNANVPSPIGNPFIGLRDLKLAQDENAYIFMGHLNVAEEKAIVFDENAETYYSDSFQEALVYNNKIYDNGAAHIFR